MHASMSTKKREELIAKLQGEIDELQKTLGDEHNPEQIVSEHIKLLHQYNEAKDAAQILIGRLATQRETTIRQIHEDYGLADDD